MSEPKHCTRCNVVTPHRRPEPTSPIACVVCWTAYEPTERELEESGQLGFLDPADQVVS